MTTTALEDLLDGLRRIIHKWVNTATPLTTDVSRGDTRLHVDSSHRFIPGDQVMIRDEYYYETGLVVDTIVNHDTIELTSPVLNDWTVVYQNVVLVKTIHEQFIQGIYIGDPDVIPRYPAITVNGVSRNSEWLTLESSKERYDVEINVYVKDSTHEQGYRFMMNIADVIQTGLKRNIIPLVNDYNIISLASDVSIGDVNIALNNRDVLLQDRRIILEDKYDMEEHWVSHLYETDPVTVHLRDPICHNFSAFDTSVIVPYRFVFNSWPADIDYGKIHKGELLKAAVIKWFAEEEEMQVLRKDELQLK